MKIPTSLILGLSLGILVLSSLGIGGTTNETPKYAVSVDVIAVGGGVSSGGNYEVNDLIGQPTTGISTGGNYQLSSGFLTETRKSETDPTPEWFIIE